MNPIQHLGLIWTFFCLRLQGLICFQNVTLTLDPPAVEFGHSVTLDCHYDLEGAPLYSVKWYRGNHEFYRYSPSEVPPKKTFPFQGFYIDEGESNGTRVVLRKVSFNLAGNVSCEVTTDAPGFKTKYATNYLHVTSLPRDKPSIHVDKDKYVAGDILRANCTSLPSRPAASLSFLLNNQPVGSPGTRHHSTPDNLLWSSLELSMQLLPSHFGDGGRLVLTCSAQIGNFYRRDAELRIGNRDGDPVPERVTLGNAASWPALNHSIWLLYLVLRWHSS